MTTVGVNRAPVWIRHSGRARDSGCDTLKKKTGVTFSGIKASQIQFGPANRVGPKRDVTGTVLKRDVPSHVIEVS